MERVDPFFLSAKFRLGPRALWGGEGWGGWVSWLASLTPALRYIIHETVTCLGGVAESSTKPLCAGSRRRCRRGSGPVGSTEGVAEASLFLGLEDKRPRHPLVSFSLILGLWAGPSTPLSCPPPLELRELKP